MPVAETSGLLGAIERWVLRTASHQLRDWSARGLDAIKLAVNLSANELHGQDTVALIGRTLGADRVDPRRLEIEVTETVAMTDQARTRRVFDQLRALGVGITIDDFGTGYFNLNYLLNLPVGKLKIAREFVSGIDAGGNSRAICRALIELAHGLGIAVVAEGTETLAEVRDPAGDGLHPVPRLPFRPPDTCGRLRPVRARAVRQALRGAVRGDRT
jgi:EAL domain-containing protein (putative c-di-GMP-specific phosphodiesterase class I)